MTNLGLLSRAGVFALFLASTVLSGEASAQSATSPAQLPKMSAPNAAAMMPIQPSAKLQGPKRSARAAQAPSGAEIARSMAATVRSRDGKESTDQLPAQLRNKLMSRQKGGALQLQGQAGKLVQIRRRPSIPTPPWDSSPMAAPVSWSPSTSCSPPATACSTRRMANGMTISISSRPMTGRTRPMAP